MSMIGEYFRLAPKDLDKAIADPDWAFDLVEGLRDAAYDGDALADPRLFDVDKAWHGIAFALERAGISTAAVFGDKQLPGADDWGYGPPSSLPPSRVAELAGQLTKINPQSIVAAVRPEEFVSADIYPFETWAADDADYLVGWLEKLIAFFTEAATAGMGMLVWLD